MRDAEMREDINVRIAGQATSPGSGGLPFAACYAGSHSCARNKEKHSPGQFKWFARICYTLNPSDSYDAVVIGAGPNRLAAAIRLAQERLHVVLLEANSTIGGRIRWAELMLPGFVHDLCSAIHPLAIASPFFRTLPLDQYGLEWIQPEFPLAHPLDDGTAVVLRRSVEETG